jgi:5-methyltetrahydrofolate--homocysteine methyltransferase
MNKILRTTYLSILEGNIGATQAGVQTALDKGVTSHDILNNALIPAMGEVGRLFETGDFFIPEMLIAARAMKAGLEIIKPLLVESGVKSIGKVAIGTVKGDMHDIGKNLVGMMLEGAGFEIIDLGTDVSPEKIIETINTCQPKIIGLSALLTTTMPNMKVAIDALQAAKVRGQVKVIIGGAPITEEYAQQIGADGFAADANQAVNLAKSLLGN